MDAFLEDVSALQKDTLKQLLELYSYDFTRRIAADVGEDGCYNYPLEQLGYFNNPNRKAYFIRSNNMLAGFVLLKVEENTRFFINEFFVLFRFRNTGIGKEIAFQLFDKFHGTWVINQADTNSPAHSFWKKTVEEYSKGQYKESQENNRTILIFEN